MTTLMLIPGLLCDESVWQPITPHLRTDLPVAIADLSSQDSIEAMARDTLHVHPGTLAVAGHSMGARVALEMFRLAPKRIERLALLNTGVHPLRDGEPAKRQAMVDLAHEEGMEALAERWLPPMVHADRHDDTDLMQGLYDMVLAKTPGLHERQIKALVGRRDAGPTLASVTCPLMLIAARQDTWSPLSQHEEMLALAPQARLKVIEDAGHFAPVERPQAVAAALNAWLEI